VFGHEGVGIVRAAAESSKGATIKPVIRMPH